MNLSIGRNESHQDNEDKKLELHISIGAIGQKWPQYKGLSPTPLAIKKYIYQYNDKRYYQNKRLEYL
jgi:hypothetical protein